jgi:glycosyltransferase involved in cell wall biosynthesis
VVKLTIVTVAYNAASVIEETLESVKNLNFKNFEYVVIDGGSNDGTNDIVRRYSDWVDCHIIESDDGIYDAMNKGVRNASGDWLLFMNAGDSFSSFDVLDDIDFEAGAVDIYYSDAIVDGRAGGRFIYVANPDKHMFNHQSFIYRRRLHDRYGYYLSLRGVSVSDYLFCAPVWSLSNSVKVDRPIAIFKWGGVSSKDDSFYQRMGADLLLGYSSPAVVVAKIVFYPVVKTLRTARSLLHCYFGRDR